MTYLLAFLAGLVAGLVLTYGLTLAAEYLRCEAAGDDESGV